MKLVCCWCHCQIQGTYTTVRVTNNIIRPKLAPLCRACYKRMTKRKEKKQ